MRIVISTELEESSNVDVLVSTKEFKEILLLLKSWGIDRFDKKFSLPNQPNIQNNTCVHEWDKGQDENFWQCTKCGGYVSRKAGEE